ncbi:MAG: hypothetical protein JRJ51_04045 [Deltaproteobacteria bacterium]|nr:hypothetical protein [Deltaproteobacteria bacterium]MBW1941987.1 hypothetical protein [Deltaproteobacteria bacterium]
MRRRPTPLRRKTLWITLLTLALWPLVSSNTASPTTIVVVRTPTEIYIGADSKITDIRNESITSTACKIRQVDDLFFAFSGLPKIPGVESDLMEIIEEASRGGGTIAEKIEEFDDIIVDEWSKGLQALKEERPQFYKEELKGKIVLQVAFAGIQNRKPVFFMMHLKAVERDGFPAIAISKKSCPGDCQQGKVIAYLGHTGALNRYMSDRSNVWKAGYVQGIRELITLQIEAQPEHVGPPIDILHINRRGAEWVQIKSECPEIE